MAINVTVLNEENSNSAAITLDFVMDILASEDDYPLSTEYEFYFKMNTTSRQETTGAAIPVKVTKTLSDLALNGNNQTARNSGSTDAYDSITEMIEDYLYDFIHGHTADQYGSGCTAQGAMDI
jgi:hypothetical protein